MQGPEWSGSVAAICDGGDVRRERGRLEGLKDVLCWVVYWEPDGAILVSASAGIMDALRSVGAQVGFGVCQGVGHDCWRRSLKIWSCGGGC